MIQGKSMRIQRNFLFIQWKSERIQGKRERIQQKPIGIQ